MKNIFNLESPLMQMLTRIGDMILLNAMFLICCIPVITIGASAAAMHKVLQEIVFETDSSTVKGFFRAFKENFKQSTIVWIAILVIIVSLVCDYVLVLTFFGGTSAEKWIMFLLGLLAVLIASVYVYLVPLLVRYENKLKQHLNNAIVLAVIKLPKTICLVVIHFLPLIVLMLSLNVFIQTLVFWIFLGFAFVAYMETVLLKKVFEELELGSDNIKIGF